MKKCKQHAKCVWEKEWLRQETSRGFYEKFYKELNQDLKTRKAAEDTFVWTRQHLRFIRNLKIDLATYTFCRPPHLGNIVAKTPKLHTTLKHVSNSYNFF